MAIPIMNRPYTQQLPIQQFANRSFMPKGNVIGAPAKNGILQRLFQSQASPVSSLTKGAGGLSGTLNNVQNVLKMVETTTPIVQKYGPMVRNLPAMYRMMKALKEVEDEDENEDEIDSQDADELAENEEVEDISNTLEAGDPEMDEEENGKNSKKHSNKGQSVPKLYI